MHLEGVVAELLMQLRETLADHRIPARQVDAASTPLGLLLIVLPN